MTSPVYFDDFAQTGHIKTYLQVEPLSNRIQPSTIVNRTFRWQVIVPEELDVT